GSADRRFEVRRLDAAGVTASDLVLGGAAGALPVRAVAYAGDALAGLVELYGRRAEDLEQVTVTAHLESASTRADLGEVRARDNGSVSREARITLPLEGVAPGDYVVRAVVREGGETIAELAREVRVLPGSAPPALSSVAGAPTVAQHAESEIARVTPADVLDGEIARRYVRELSEAARGSALQGAASQAARGTWTAVEPALGSEPSDGNRTWFALRGLARYAAGRFDLATADVQIAAGDPPAALPSFILGWIHASAGERRDAIGAWRAAAHADPTLVPAHLAIADAYVRAAEPALAIQALKAGLRALPGSPELRERLAALEGR
ncbi:MAG: tetratricopeptide repeat protein, partial [Vicinamibacterales bacterium]